MTDIVEIVWLEEQLAGTRRLNTKLVEAVEKALDALELEHPTDDDNELLDEACKTARSALELKWENLV